MPENNQNSIHQNHCRALIRLDDKKIRKTHASAAARTLKKLARLEEKAANYSRVDQKLYEEWYQKSFGEELKLIEAQERLLRDLREFNFEMYSISRHKKIPLTGAYRWAKEEKRLYESGDEHIRAEIRKIQKERMRFLWDEQEKEAADRAEKERNRREKQRKKWDNKSCDPEEAGSNEEEVNTGFTAHDLDEHSGKEEEHEDCWGNEYDFGFYKSFPEPLTPAQSERMKLLYRQLARLLHPDLRGTKNSGKMAPWQLQLWSKAQESLEQKDLEKLEDCLRMARFRLNELRSLTIGEILECRKNLEKEFRALSASARWMKREVAWNFSTKKVTASLVSKIAEDLKLRKMIAECHLSSIHAEHLKLEKESG